MEVFSEEGERDWWVSESMFFSSALVCHSIVFGKPRGAQDIDMFMIEGKSMTNATKHLREAANGHCRKLG